MAVDWWDLRMVTSRDVEVEEIRVGEARERYEHALRIGDSSQIREARRDVGEAQRRLASVRAIDDITRNRVEAGIAELRTRLGVHESSETRADDEWFRRLFEENYSTLRGFARRLVGDAEADDVVMEAFMRLYRRPPDSELSSLRSYLYMVVRRVAMDSLRRERVFRSRELAALEELQESAEVVAEEVIAQRDQLILVRQALDSLPVTERELLMLTLFEGFTTAEAADVLGVAHSTARVRARRAVYRLRGVLTELQDS
ncbi:MAG: sigma-70 family RNA polymerase sigma factor [Acidimicrobiales bacterium]